MTRRLALLVLASCLGAGGACAQEPVSLPEAVRRALASDETLRQAAQAVAAAEAGLVEARAGRLPTLDLAARYATNLKLPVMFLPPDLGAAFGGVTRLEMGRDLELGAALTARLNLWTAGRLAAAEGAAGEGLAAARFREDAVRDYVRYATTVAYADALLARAELANAELALAESAEAARLARLGLEQGTTSRFDSQRADVELANHRPRVVQARSRVAGADLGLARLCGVDVAPADTLAAASAPAPEAELLARMRERSPELKALSAVVAARRQQLRLAAAGRGPVVQVAADYAVQGQWDQGLLPGEDEAAASSQVALAVQLPLFDGRRTAAAVAGARAALEAARLEAERALRDRELAVRRAALSVRDALAALEGARENVRLAQETHRLAVVRLESGVGTPLERLDAERALATARAQLATALHASNLAQAALELAVGGNGA